MRAAHNVVLHLKLMTSARVRLMNMHQNQLVKRSQYGLRKVAVETP